MQCKLPQKWKCQPFCFSPQTQLSSDDDDDDCDDDDDDDDDDDCDEDDDHHHDQDLDGNICVPPLARTDDTKVAAADLLQISNLKPENVKTGQKTGET